MYDMRYDELGEEIQNTKSMRMDPQPQEKFNMMDVSTSNKLEFLPVMTGDYFKKLCCYPILVEMWEKKKYGRIKREWENTFTKAERKKIGGYYGRFYRWYLISGTPERVLCKINTIRLLQRAVNFFATI